MTLAAPQSRAGARGMHLVTFADGSDRWTRAGRRFARQASTSGWFTSVTVWSLTDVHGVDSAFTSELDRAFAEGQRGPGLWAWRPLLLDAYLNDASLRADSIVFVDAGSHLNVTARALQRLRQYEELAIEDGAVLMEMQHLPEREWTKPSVMDYFGLDDAQRHSGQIMGGVLVLANDSRARSLVRAWLDAVRWNRGELLLDPDPSEHPLELVAHRHDQSVLSCLAKSQSVSPIRDETFFGPSWGAEADAFPIWTVRNRTGAYYHRSPTLFRSAKAIDRLRTWLPQGSSRWA